VGNDADSPSRTRECLLGMGVVLGSKGAMFIAAVEKNGAPSVAMPATTFGSSIDMSPKAEENPPS